jgi:hypothetical protein
MRPDGPNAGRILMSSTVVRKPGQKRSPIEERHGDVLEQSTGRWLRITRIIDRRNNRYYEKILVKRSRKVHQFPQSKSAPSEAGWR